VRISVGASAVSLGEEPKNEIIAEPEE